YIQHPGGSHVVLAGLLGYESLQAALMAGLVRCGLIDGTLFLGFTLQARARARQVMNDYDSMVKRFTLNVWTGGIVDWHLSYTHEAASAKEAELWLATLNVG